MAYDSNTQIISAPVSVYDVQRALGNGSSDVGTLCKANTVNKWAKYKPVGKNKIDTTDELRSDKTWKNGSVSGETAATWWKGTNQKCGINYVTYASIALTKSAIDAKTAIWSRVAPVGGGSEPFRLIDFNEYHHLAFPPTYALSASNAQLKAGSTLKIMVATSVDDGYSVRFSDIGSFDNYYHTVAIYDGSGNLKLIHSASKRVGLYGDGETIEIEIPYNNGTYGYQGKLQENQTYYAYAFISSDQYTCATREFVGNYTYIPMPCGNADYGMQPTSFMAKADLKWAMVDAFCPSGGRIVNWTVDLYGAGSPTATIRLIDLKGNIISGQTVSLNFATGAQSKNGGTSHTTTVSQVQAGDGTIGYEMSDVLQTALTLPNNNPEMYLVEFVCSAVDTVRAGIGHDINTNV